MSERTSIKEELNGFSFRKEQAYTITVQVQEESPASSTRAPTPVTKDSPLGDKPSTNNQGAKRDSSISLPPIDHILKSIDVYQTQQQLSDSQLLLEFNQCHKVHTPSIQDNNARPILEQQQQQQQITQNDEPLPQQEPSENASKITIIPSMESIHQFEKENLDTQPISGATTNGTNPDSGTPPPYAQQTPFQFKSEDPSLPNKRRRAPQDGIQSQKKYKSNQTNQSGSSTDVSIEPLSRQSSVELMDDAGNKKRTNLPRETIEILNDWIMDNMDYPYPNHTEKRMLLERTGLSSIQLSNWFINKRRRRIFSNLSGNNGQPIKKKRLIDRI